jgi:hypothetical protein
MGVELIVGAVATLGAGVPALLAKDAGRLGVKALFKNGSKAGQAAMKQSARATRAARSQLDNLGSKTRKLRRSSNEATETTTRTLRCGCFTAGTKVVMADGVARAIDQVETGDTVVGRDGATGADQPGQVTNTLTREQAPTLVVSTTAGNITTTAEHPFYVDGSWVAAGDLEAGDQLESQDGTPVTVTALTPTLDVATVYNLTIADLHTYYIRPDDSVNRSDTDAAVLVHNRPGVPCDSLGDPRGGVYRLMDGDRVMRTGRTSNLDSRRLDHRRPETTSRYGFDAVYRTDDYATQRGLEQMLYDASPSALSSNGGLNRIRPISQRNPRFEEYMRAARSFKERFGLP